MVCVREDVQLDEVFRLFKSSAVHTLLVHVVCALFWAKKGSVVRAGGARWRACARTCSWTRRSACS